MPFDAPAMHERSPESGGDRSRAPAGPNRCRYCRERIDQVDYKSVYVLSKSMTGQGKMHSRRRSGCCSFHQRSLKRALRRARFLGLVPYTG